ncbi:MAG: TetR family transcriptional regulator [Rhodobacterales bacterium]|nr:TetR family transcriptional regulator [Rhodobacterales bacterium]
MAIAVSEGLDQLTMPRLARSLNVAVGGLYRYFSGKEMLIGALQVRAVGVFAEVLNEAQRGVQGGSLLRLVVTVRTWRSFAETHPAMHHLIDAGLSDPRRLLSDEQALVVQATLDPVLEAVAACLSDAVVESLLSPGDVRVRTYILWAGIHGLDHFRKRDERLAPGVRSGPLVTALLRSLLLGWGATVTNVQRALGDGIH